ncbi:hypothetical protein BJX76DRAFT_358073 [Aspergillus varians]
MADLTYCELCNKQATDACIIEHCAQIQSRATAVSNNPLSIATGEGSNYDGLDPFLFSRFIGEPAFMETPTPSPTEIPPITYASSEDPGPSDSICLSPPIEDVDPGNWRRILHVLGFRNIGADWNTAAGVLREIRDKTADELAADKGVVVDRERDRALALKNMKRASELLETAKVELDCVQEGGSRRAEELGDLITRLEEDIDINKEVYAQLDTGCKKAAKDLQMKELLHLYLRKRYSEAGTRPAA